MVLAFWIGVAVMALVITSYNRMLDCEDKIYWEESRKRMDEWRNKPLSQRNWNLTTDEYRTMHGVTDDVPPRHEIPRW